MLIVQKRYNKGRKGVIKFQAVYRGRDVRKVQAATEVQKVYRKFIAAKRFRQIVSAVISLQCRERKRSATAELNELKREQKDVGKLKQNNDKLKNEMASLRAMLAAQAKEGESEAKNAKELQAKQDEINALEKRISELERELEHSKKLVEKLEGDMANKNTQHEKEMEQMEQRLQFAASQASTRAPSAMPGSPQSPKRKMSAPVAEIPALPEGEDGVTVNPELLARQRAHVQKLEDQLEAEKRLRREADGEIIKLRAANNGVNLGDAEVNALLGKTKQEAAPSHPKVVDLVKDTRYVFLSFIRCLLCAVSSFNKGRLLLRKEGGAVSSNDHLSFPISTFHPENTPMFFRLLFILLVAIVALMLSWNALRWRLASIRVKRHGLALANETGSDIDLGVLKEMSSSISFLSIDTDAADFASTAH